MRTISNYSTKASSSSNQHIQTKASISDGQAGTVEGGECGIRLPENCVALLVQLTDKLGHDTIGQTIEWLFKQAEPSIVVTTGRGISSINTPSTQAVENLEENAIVRNEDKDLVKKKRAQSSQPLPPPYDEFMRLVTNYNLEFTANDVAVDVGILTQEEDNNQNGYVRLE